MPNDILIRAASIRANSFNREARTFVAVLATGTPIQRRGGYEVLDLASMQLPANAPLLLDHRASVDALVGRAENIRRDGDTIVADCRISGDPALASLCERIADGTVYGISIGYSVPRWNETRSASGERTRIAVGAVLRHAALVAEPADSNAGIRSRRRRRRSIGDRDRRADQRRDAQTRQLCRALGWTPDLIDRAVAERWDDQRIMEHTRDRSGRLDIRTTGHVILDDPEVHRTAMRDNLVARMAGTEAAGAGARAAEPVLAGAAPPPFAPSGHRVAGLSDQEVIVRALSTSDMPIIAGAAVNVRIRQTYDAAISRRSPPCLARAICRTSGRRSRRWSTGRRWPSARSAKWASFARPTSPKAARRSRSTRSAGSPACRGSLWINGAGALAQPVRGARPPAGRRRERSHGRLSDAEHARRAEHGRPGAGVHCGANRARQRAAARQHRRRHDHRKRARRSRRRQPSASAPATS